MKKENKDKKKREKNKEPCCDDSENCCPKPKETKSKCACGSCCS